jgi:hypothetical protein
MKVALLRPDTTARDSNTDLHEYGAFSVGLRSPHWNYDRRIRVVECIQKNACCSLWAETHDVFVEINGRPIAMDAMDVGILADSGFSRLPLLQLLIKVQ